MKHWRRRWTVPGLSICLLLAAAAAGARPYAGSVLGEVTDIDGQRLDAVRVTLEGPGGERLGETDEDGRFRFDDLEPGSYELRLAGDGYAGAVYEPLHIRAGRATSVRVQMSPAAGETVVVATEPPAAAVASRSERGRPPRLEIGGTPLVVAQGGDGVLLDLVTSRTPGPGRAEVGLDLVDRTWQSGADPLGPDRRRDPTPRILGLLGVGADAGLGVLDDRLHLWGAYGLREVDRRAPGGQVQSLRLEHTGVKIQAQATAGTTAVLSAHRGGQERFGQGAGVDRLLDATSRQTEPSRALGVEVQHVAAEDLLLRLRAERGESGTLEVPLGDVDHAVLGPDGVWRGGVAESEYLRGTNTWELESQRYYRSPEGEHDVRMGIRNQQINTSEAERWGPSDLVWLAGENFGTPFDLLRVRRAGDLRVGRTFTSLWVEDSLSGSGGRGSWTFDYGLRYDAQKGLDHGGTVASNPLFPDLLPGLDYDGAVLETTWDDFSPRLGVAWAPGEDRRTVLRASYGSYASRMHEDHVGRTSPLAAAELLLAFDEPADGGGRFDPSQPFRVLDRLGVDPFVPGSSTQPNANDGLLRSERTDELRLGVEHHLGHATELSLDYAVERVERVLETRRFVRTPAGAVRLATVDDYRLDSVYSGLLPDGSPFSAPVYGLADGLEYTGGSLLANGDREQIRETLTLGVHRRLSRGLMLRGKVTLSDWRWHVGRSFAEHDDPTNDAPPSPGAAAPELGHLLDGADDHGDVVVRPAGEGVYVNSRWSFDLLALYQLAPQRPWGFDVGLQVHGREGYPVPYAVTVATADGLRRVQATSSVGTFRLDDIVTVDLRLQKQLRFGRTRATLSIDGYNLLDADSVLERRTGLDGPLADSVLQTLSPRVFQVGLRLAL